VLVVGWLLLVIALCWSSCGDSLLVLRQSASFAVRKLRLDCGSSIVLAHAAHPTLLLALLLLLRLLPFPQAIDKLEAMLNGGMKQGKTSMFGPKEYVTIYT